MVEEARRSVRFLSSADLDGLGLGRGELVDILEAAFRAKAAGGRVVAGPKGYAAYRYVVIEDPAGASFVACEEVQS